MTLKEIVDEELSMDSINQKLSLLNTNVANFNKKLAANPALANSLGTDSAILSKLAVDTQKEFQNLVKQNMANEAKQKVEQQKKELEKNKALMANGNVVTNNNANNNIAISANGMSN